MPNLNAMVAYIKNRSGYKGPDSPKICCIFSASELRTIVYALESRIYEQSTKEEAHEAVQNERIKQLEDALREIAGLKALSESVAFGLFTYARDIARKALGEDSNP